MKRLGVFPPQPDGMLVHRRSFPRNLLGFPTNLPVPLWGTVRVKCLAQEHNTMSPARARTRTTRSGDERTNHEASAPPTLELKLDENKKNSLKYGSLAPLTLQRTEWTEVLSSRMLSKCFPISNLAPVVCFCVRSLSRLCYRLCNYPHES